MTWQWSAAVPRGTSAAVTAAPAAAQSNVLCDRSDFPRQKVCGEFVSAESLGLLRGLLGESEKGDEALRGAPVIAQARIFASGRMAETAIQPSGLSIPRSVLDLLLWECARGGRGVCAHGRCEVLSISWTWTRSRSLQQGEFSASAVIRVYGSMVTVFRFQHGGCRAQVDWRQGTLS